AAGRELVDRAVSDRTRAFAAYGLGMHAGRSDRVSTKRAAFEALAAVLHDESVVSRDVRIAALQAVSLLDIDRGSYRGAVLAQEVLAVLEAFFASDRGIGEQQVQAHCPTAIARLLDRDDPAAERHKERFAAILEGAGLDGRKARRRVQNAVTQSCALALGQLVRPDQDGDLSKDRDVHFSDVLRRTWTGHKDAQTSRFAVLALGQIGGAHNREYLLKALSRASRVLEQPWCALALGLCAEQRRQRTGEVDQFVGEELQRRFARAKNPEALGALAIALGLARCEDARPDLTRALSRHLGKEVAPVSICQALSMLEADASQEALQAALPECDRRPRLFEEATRALGRLGDAKVADALLRRLAGGEANYEMQLALATALGDVGGADQVEPLVAIVADGARSAVTRAGAARALGGIVDRGPLRWNTVLRENANYRASVATLTDGAGGVLDLR
ncbi:MAG: HEAT repeat domain-containing protein, partial [Planctomycetes bacterium]|nr:HEAT repeat domain-containing protein [Planctomycetota bacterium]